MGGGCWELELEVGWEGSMDVWWAGVAGAGFQHLLRWVGRMGGSARAVGAAQPPCPEHLAVLSRWLPRLTCPPLPPVRRCGCR